MADLTARERQKLPRSDFARPGKGEGKKGAGSGSFPIPDRAHGRAALSRSADKSPAVKAEVRRAVERKFPSIDKGGKRK